MTSAGGKQREPDVIPKEGSAHPAPCIVQREQENPDRLTRPGFDAG